MWQGASPEPRDSVRSRSGMKKRLDMALRRSLIWEVNVQPHDLRGLAGSDVSLGFMTNGGREAIG